MEGKSRTPVTAPELMRLGGATETVAPPLSKATSRASSVRPVIRCYELQGLHWGGRASSETSIRATTSEGTSGKKPSRRQGWRSWIRNCGTRLVQNTIVE